MVSADAVGDGDVVLQFELELEEVVVVTNDGDSKAGVVAETGEGEEVDEEDVGESDGEEAFDEAFVVIDDEVVDEDIVAISDGPEDNSCWFAIEEVFSNGSI